MLYVGHFSSDVLEDESSHESPPIEYDHSSFTCVVEAGSAEEALDKFRGLILSVDESEPFERLGDIYLDVGIEIRELPQGGLITRVEHRLADGSGAVSMSLPGGAPEGCAAFDWGREPGPDNTEEEGEFFETPFMPLEQ